MTRNTTRPKAVRDALKIVDPLGLLDAGMDEPDTEMAMWAIESMSAAVHQTQYRTLFRSAAHVNGEAGVLQLLKTMVKSTKPIRHNALVLASSQVIAVARAEGKGIPPGDKSGDLLPAVVLAQMVIKATLKGCSLSELSEADQSADGVGADEGPGDGDA